MDPFSLLAGQAPHDFERRMLERDLGPQPLMRLMDQHGLKAKDLVAVSEDQLNHKMVARACKGRRLTSNVKGKVLRALIAASGERYTLAQLFNY